RPEARKKSRAYAGFLPHLAEAPRPQAGLRPSSWVRRHECPHGQARVSRRPSPHVQTHPRTRAGLPATRACGATSRATTAPAATKAYAPMVTPHTTVAFAPMVAPRRTRVGSHPSGPRLMAARGRRSLVKMALGPTKTSSSIVTLFQTSTAFLIVTPEPITAPPSTKAWSQMLQSDPITAPGSTWANAQIRVPDPTRSLSQR